MATLEELGKLTECPKCGRPASPLSKFCTQKECPVRPVFRVKEQSQKPATFANKAEAALKDARLVATAPDLLAALEDTAETLRSYGGDPSTEDGWTNEELRDAWLAARAVIKKARGE